VQTITDSQIIKIAQRLAGKKVLAMKAVEKGGNNRLFKVITASEHYALKFHLHIPGDPRNRQATETRALVFLHDHGINQVPQLHGQDRENRCSLMEWVDGETINAPTTADIDNVLTFITQLQKLGTSPKAKELAPASAACLSGAILESQVRERLARLKAGTTMTDHPELAIFIQENFSPLLEEITATIQTNYQQANLDFHAEIPTSCRILSPSDFGFHNCLRRIDSKLIFLDFEYFGWDDPVKMACDFLHHPGMNIASKDNIKNRFIQGVVKIFQDDRTLPFRMQQLYPLFGLCWCMIILNEFTVEGWQRKSLVTGKTLDKQTISIQQLDKAKQLLLSLGKETLALND
jgi:hypothetical protein